LKAPEQDLSEYIFPWKSF